MQRPVMILPFEKMEVQDRRQATVSLALAAASLFSGLPAYAKEEKKKKEKTPEFPTAPGLGKGTERLRERLKVMDKRRFRENRVVWNTKPGKLAVKARRVTNYRNYLPLSEQNVGFRPNNLSDCKGFFPKRGLACPGGKWVPRAETLKPGWKNPLVVGDLMFGTNRAPNTKTGLEDVKFLPGIRF